MNDESKTKLAGTGRRLCRHGKIARLPHAVREELNLRLQDGESGKGLIAWLKESRIPLISLIRVTGVSTATVTVPAPVGEGNPTETKNEVKNQGESS